METSIIDPQKVNLDTVSDVFSAYEAVKARILTGKDVLYIGSRGRPVSDPEKGVPYITRSGWAKLARAFSISFEILSRERITTENGYLWMYKVRASHPGGAFADAEGAASSLDKFLSANGPANEAHIIAKAQTVAFNRATSAILGSGDVSADEMPVEMNEAPRPPQTRKEGGRERKEWKELQAMGDIQIVDMGSGIYTINGDKFRSGTPDEEEMPLYAFLLEAIAMDKEETMRRLPGLEVKS